MQVEQESNPKKKWIVVGLIALITIIVGINIAVIQSKNKVATDELKFVKAEERVLSITKLLSGTVLPSSEETFYFDPGRGKIQEIFVQEGQQIQPGQQLFSYNNPELSIQLKQLAIDKEMTSLRFDLGNRKLESLKKEIQTAKKLKSAKVVVAPMEEQLQDLQLQQKTIGLEMEKNKLYEEELLLKQGELVVSSSIVGVVQTVDQQLGLNSAQGSGIQGNPVVRIASEEPFQIQGTVTELQKAFIQPNQPISITAKAMTNKKWIGKILSVSQYPLSQELSQMSLGATGQSSQNISYYSFKAAIDSVEDLSAGYHVSIKAELDSKKVLAVPRTSIVEKADSKYVFVMMDKKLAKKKITAGTGDGEWIEVIKGLKSGVKVVDHPSTALYEGMEVKSK